MLLIMRRRCSCYSPIVGAALGGLLALSPIDLARAQSVGPAPDRAAVVAAARDVMAKARYCSLITVAADGRLQARIMDPFSPDEAMVVWMGTNIASRKVAELRADPRATLTCWFAGDQAYVTLQGRADVVTDPGEIAKRWKPEWAAFYPLGAKDPTYALLRFRTNRLEVVSPAHGIMNDPKTWQPVGVDLPASAERFVRGRDDEGRR
jgi:general stress protein 26